MSQHWQLSKIYTMKTKSDLMLDKLLKIEALTELYELGKIAYDLKNEEMQLVLTERISSTKGEIAELERQIANLENKPAEAA